MDTTDIGAYFVVYNFIIGVLLMASSEKLGCVAGSLTGGQNAAVIRYTRLSTFTFGATVSVIMAFIYLVFHVMRIGI